MDVNVHSFFLKCFFIKRFAIVAKCLESPVIDGKGYDLCWKNSVACTDFLRVNSEFRADGQTSVRFCYDDRCLYALFVCNEPILNPVLQRVHEFAANVKERDSIVWQDDWVAMILKPNTTGKDAYDFFTNALGTLMIHTVCLLISGEQEIPSGI